MLVSSYTRTSIQYSYINMVHTVPGMVSSAVPYLFILLVFHIPYRIYRTSVHSTRTVDSTTVALVLSR